MMRPPSRRCRAASCVATNKPRTLMAISFSKSSSENCSMGAKIPVPALFTRISMAPNVPMVLATASRTALVSAASALIASAFPPAASIERTTSLALPGDALYVRATAAPSVASRLAIAAPMLREPPVTSATFPASFLVFFVLINVSCDLRGIETWLLPGDQHDSEASFVSHHASVSFGSICQRNSFDHRMDLLQGAEGKRVLRIYRGSGHCPRDRTHTEKKWNRVNANRLISSGSGDN